MTRSSARGGMLVVTLGVAVLALGLAVFALVRPTGTQPQYTDAQRSDAETAICAAFQTVRTGVETNTNRQPPGGADDIGGALAVAANARVALYDGGQYLLARLDPATPADLADQIRKFGNQLMDIGAAATAGVPNTDPAQSDRLEQAEATGDVITGLCG